MDCLICQQKFETDKSLHAHLKKHDMKQYQYYHKFFPRKDLYTGELIRFKSKSQYFDSYFNEKDNIKKYFKKITETEQKKFIINLLNKRKIDKELEFSMSEVELISLGFPPIYVMNRLFENYYILCESLGFQNRYNFDLDLASLNDEPFNKYKILVDTREQNCLNFQNTDIEIKKLDYGDYSCEKPALAGNVFVERKELSDFINTMSGGFDRFKEEIERAAIDNAYLVVLVESSLNIAIKFNKYDQIKRKATPDFIFHNVRELFQEYGGFCQFLFVKDRVEAARMVKKLFVLGEKCRKIDLQYFYNSNII